QAAAAYWRVAFQASSASPISRGTTQRIVAALVQAMDVVAVETFVPDLHIGAECVDGGELLDREADRFRRRREAPIAGPLLRTALALRHEQFGRHVVVEFHDIAFDGRTRLVSRHSTRLS